MLTLIAGTILLSVLAVCYRQASRTMERYVDPEMDKTLWKPEEGYVDSLLASLYLPYPHDSLPDTPGLAGKPSDLHRDRQTLVETMR